MKQTPQSLGGQARAKTQREEALKRYYDNPNYCLNCGKIIKVYPHQKVASVRVKKFCNSSCSATHRNKTYKRPKEKLEPCPDCGGAKSKDAMRCMECYGKSMETIASSTIDELFSRRKNYTSARSDISRCARKIYQDSNKSYECFICGYTHYTEVCHIRAVKDFPKTALISEVNSIENLITLCPNHHREHDDGILEIV